VCWISFFIGAGIATTILTIMFYALSSLMDRIPSAMAEPNRSSVTKE